MLPDVCPAGRVCVRSVAGRGGRARKSPALGTQPDGAGAAPAPACRVPARAMKVAGGEWAPLGGAVRVRRFLGVGRPSPPSSFPVLFMEAQPASLLLPSWSDH